MSFWVEVQGGGVGRVWGIGPGEVVVEMDYCFLVSFKPEHVTPYEPELQDAVQ